MRQKNYTLVELLTVIAIIVLLQGMIFPVVGHVKSKAKITAASQEMNACYLAITSFEQEYGRFPSGRGEGISSDDLVKNEDGDIFYGISSISGCLMHKSGESVSGDEEKAVAAYCNFFDILTYTKRSNVDAGNKDLSDSVKKQNSRKKAFLEVKDGYFADNDINAGFRDPWGFQYVVAIDADGDGMITIPGKLMPDNKATTVHKAVCLISAGPQDSEFSDPSKMDKKSFIYSWK